MMTKHTGIEKRGSKYRARYFSGWDSQGKRIYISRTFSKLGDAIKWRAAGVNAKGIGQRFESHRLTVEQYLTQWLETKKQSLRSNSWNMYSDVAKNYIIPIIGAIKLSRLAPAHIEEMQTILLNRKLSASTVLSARIVLGGALKKATRLGLIQANPVESTDGPKRPKPKRYPLDVEQAMRLIAACESSRFGLLFQLMIATGLRNEELIGLTWGDLELGERGIIHVRRVILKLRGGGWEWSEPKSENGIRSIVFPGELVAKLAEHRRRQLERKMKIGSRWQNHDLVFSTRIGTPIRNCALHYEFKAITKRAGIPKEAHIYDLRHAWVSLSLIAGVDVKTTSREAGHASISFTLQHYGHVLPEMHEAASDLREKLLKERSSR